MSEIEIRVENLSKIYRIGQHEAYRTLRDTITHALSAPFRRLKECSESKNKTQDYIWALKDVSFDIKKGEVVGIIGRNGAGKTTLLKILSRITPPTQGLAEVYGRVGSLLEVGTGFHSELTGRENIYFNGAMLGMKKAEIDRKFNQIVEFAETGKFLDTPLKYYSSGMAVRLAFAVAAHLEQEILLVDEVLAVGDSAFQKKCIGKMDSVARTGRTVLFVSHQMNQIRRLCQRSIWLDAGGVRGIGPTEEVLGLYEVSLTSKATGTERSIDDQLLDAQFLKWEISQPQQESPNIINTFGPVEVNFYLKVNKAILDGRHGIALLDVEDRLMWGADIDNLRLEEGIHKLTYRLSTVPVKPGVYYWYVTIHEGIEVVDKWYCFPELLVNTLPLSHRRDECAGFLNLPYEFNAYKIP
jgi:lipopolysaccharide transport system ATP-binding protein